MFSLINEIDKWSATSAFVLPVILSFIAGLVFWVIFSYIPDNKRRRKLRPVVELALYDVYKLLFQLFDAILRHQENSPSFYQKEIRSGQLTEEIIKLGLANKCLNESYLFDKNINQSLIVIGHRIVEYSHGIDEIANKIISFNEYASAQEILLMEKIREEIRKYHFNEKSVTSEAKAVIGGKAHYPVNPTISYRSRNFYEIYLLFCELQEIILNRMPLNRDRIIYKTQYLFYSGQHRACRNFIRTSGKKFSSDVSLFNTYLALSERAIGNMKKYYRKMEDTFKGRPHSGSLVSSRSFFMGLIEDKKLLEILTQYYSAEEIAALKKSVQDDSEQQAAFEKSNKALAEYYQAKVANI